jgi:Cu(I)/Ag(I) efflux system membrane protein CusA/SilA
VDVAVEAGAAARFGLTTGDVQQALATAVGGASAGQVFEGRERFSVLVRYPRGLRDSPEQMANVIVPTASGDQVILGQLARIEVVRGPALVKSENATPNNVVYVDVRDRDVGSYVADAKRAVERAVALPTGYRIEWSGQYEALERASRRLRWVVPVTLLIIYLLLHANFRGAAESLLIMLSLPFALVGGVWYLWLLDFHMSVAVAVGLIALAGVAAETGVVMLLYLDHAFAERVASGTMRTRADLDAAVEAGAVERLRPKMMTVTAIMAGLIPILWSEGAGADVMKRIAAPMVGGMVTSTLLVLLVLPALYSLWKNATALGAREIDSFDPTRDLKTVHAHKEPASFSQ